MVDNNIIAIIRARMNSTRLPKKMMMPIIDGKSALEVMINRVQSVELINKIIVATTEHPDDDDIVRVSSKNGCYVFRGSEENVLDRCYQAALPHQPCDGIVILTGDCLLLDINITNEIIRYYLNSDFDYVSNNNVPTTYPDGLDVEICNFETLEKIWKGAATRAEKEHITFYLQKPENAHRFKKMNLKYKDDLSSKGWCLDTPEDLEFIKIVYDRLYHKNNKFGMNDILALLGKEPDIEKINQKQTQNQWRDNSIKEDKVKEKVEEF